jgi:hypothetical protein
MRPRYLAILLSFFLLACGPARVSVDEAEQAFVAAFSGAYIGSFFVQLGETTPGVELREDTDEMVFDQFDISELGTGYTTISGTARTTAETLQGSFTLTEGPVETLEFELSVDQMRSETIVATVTANGREVDIAIETGGTQLLAPPER